MKINELTFRNILMLNEALFLTLIAKIPTVEQSSENMEWDTLSSAQLASSSASPVSSDWTASSDPSLFH
jgi:hypothetical protein